MFASPITKETEIKEEGEKEAEEEIPRAGPGSERGGCSDALTIAGTASYGG